MSEPRTEAGRLRDKPSWQPARDLVGRLAGNLYVQARENHSAWCIPLGRFERCETESCVRSRALIEEAQR